MHTRMEVRLYLLSSGLAISVEYIVGTPQKTVTFWFWMVCMIFWGSNFGIKIIFAAKLMGTVMLVVMPYMWNSGKAVRNVSCVGVPFIQAAKAMAFETRFVWVSMAPLDIPVVPPVYCRAAKSSAGFSCTFRVFSEDSSIRALKDRVLSVGVEVSGWEL